MVGPICFMGIRMMYYQDVLPIANVFRGQMEFRISNVQILDLHSVESTNSKEIFVK